MAGNTKYISVDRLEEFLTKLKAAYAANSASAFSVNYAANATNATNATNDSDGKQITTEYLHDSTGALLTKINGIEQGAQVNVIEAIATSEGDAVTMNGKTATINLSAYAKKADVTAIMDFQGTKTSDELAALTGMKKGDVYSIVAGGTGTTYKVGSEYVYDGSAWVELGPIVDLSGYIPRPDSAADSNIVLFNGTNGNIKDSGIPGAKLSGGAVASGNTSFVTGGDVHTAITALGNIVNDVKVQVGSGTATSIVSSGIATLQIADTVANDNNNPVTSDAVFDAIGSAIGALDYSKVVEDDGTTKIAVLQEASASDINAMFGQS